MSGVSGISEGDMLAYIKAAAERSPLDLARERAQAEQNSGEKVEPPLPPPDQSPSENEDGEDYGKAEDQVGGQVQIEYAGIAGFGIEFTYVYKNMHIYIYIHIYMYIATFYMYVQDFKVKVYMCNIESVVARCR